MMKSFLVNAFAVIVIIVLGYGVFRMYSRGLQLVREFEMLKAQIASIEEENKALERDIEYYSYPENLEKEARARLNVKKPGEKMIIITPSRQTKTENSVMAREASGDGRSLWKKIEEIFTRD